MRSRGLSSILMGLALASLGRAQPVYFADANLKAAVEQTLDVTNPTPMDMLSLGSLVANGVGIQSLTGLEYAKNLTYLILKDNQISDLSPLASLGQMSCLSLSGNQISDISPISGMNHLQGLDLMDNQVSDLSALVGKTDLEVLVLHHNQITDISALQGMTKLKELYLNRNQVSDISALAGMYDLEELHLGDNQISDIGPLKGMTKLRGLALQPNQGIEDISVLSDMTAITHLWLGNNHISDISALSGMNNLVWLDLNRNNITDISALAGKTRLKQLVLPGNRISDISVLSDMTELEQLILGGCQLISDISVLSGLVKLRELDIGWNRVSDISPLSGMEQMTKLGLYFNPISDLSPLSGMRNLSELLLEGCQVEDISVLSDKSLLRFLALPSNRVRDISSLANLTSLSYLDLLRNPLGSSAYTIYIPRIVANNPGIELLYDEPLWRTLTISSGEGGSVIAPGEGQFQYIEGEQVAVEAAPESDAYRFAAWSGTAPVVNRLSQKTTAIVIADCSLRAEFKRADDPWQVAYAQDFEGVVGSEWSRTTTDATPLGERRFLGQFGNHTVTLTLHNLPPHAQATVSFDLFIILSWDGNGPDPNAPGPDIWKLVVDRTRTLLQTTFDNHPFPAYAPLHRQSFPDSHPGGDWPPQTGASETSTLGYTRNFRLAGVQPADAVYHLTFTFGHSAEELALSFSASGLQGISDEGWGLDNVQVEVSKGPPVFLIAHDPFPANGARNVTSPVLQWKGGQTAVYHDVYLDRNADLGVGSFVGRQSTTDRVIPYALVPGTTYYWRVDEVEADGATRHQGEVWSFTTGELSTLTVSAAPGGSVLTPGEGQFEILSGTILTLEATELDASRQFREWSGTAVAAGKVAEPNAPETTVLVDGDYTLEAVFTERPGGPAYSSSLGAIDADDSDQFTYRTTTNNTAEAAFVERVTGLPPDPGGMIRLRVIEEEPARVKGRFGKCLSEGVLVGFSYLFDNANVVALVVYVSNVPQLLDHNDPAWKDHYLEVGRVLPPPAGRPGAVGSGVYGQFEQWVSVAGLDLSDGLYVELELVRQAPTGPPPAGLLRVASVASDEASVDDWWAGGCYGICMDLNNNGPVDVKDYVRLPALCGRPVGEWLSWCLEGAFGPDGFVGSTDLASLDWMLDCASCQSFCGVASLPVAATPASEPPAVSTSMPGGSTAPAGLLILGKRQGTGAEPNLALQDRLYSLEPDASFKSPYDPLGFTTRWNLRLIRSTDGQAYVASSQQGLADLEGRTLVRPGRWTGVTEPRYSLAAQVYVGIQDQDTETFGRPILDAHIDGNEAYLVPVVVVPDGWPDYAYLAAAKLSLADGTLLRLYDDPNESITQSPNPDNPNLMGLRELEADDAGNVYVLNVQRRNRSTMLWKYSASESDLPLRVELDRLGILDPVGLCLASDGLYVASGQHDWSDPNTVRVYKLAPADLTLLDTIRIPGMYRVMDITEQGSNGTLWVVGYGLDALAEVIVGRPESKYRPCAARIEKDGKVTLTNLEGQAADLALPTSAVWIEE